MKLEPQLGAGSHWIVYPIEVRLIAANLFVGFRRGSSSVNKRKQSIERSYSQLEFDCARRKVTARALDGSNNPRRFASFEQRSGSSMPSLDPTLR